MAEKLVEQGAKEIYAMVAHGALSKDGIAKIDASPIRELLITDTIEDHAAPFSDKIKVESVAPLLGEAIRRIHNRESISAMFPSEASKD